MPEAGAGRGGWGRLLLISPEYPPSIGGVGDYTHHLSRRLSDRGVEVAVVCSSAVSTTDGSVHIVGGARWDFRLLRYVEALARVLNPHVVHLQYQTAAYGMHPAVNLIPRWFSRRLPDVPVVTTMHDLREPYLFPKAGPLRRWVTRQLVRYSRTVIASNPSDAWRLDDMGGEVTLIPIGPNIFPVQPGAITANGELAADAWQVRTEWTVPLSAHLIGYFGFLNRTKGVEHLFRALRRLVDRGCPIVLAILGDATGAFDATARQYQGQLRKLAHALNLEPYLRWTGPLAPDVFSRGLSALDCCVLPYEDGGSYGHGTLITALTHGLPVVTTQPLSQAHVFPSAPPPLVDQIHCMLVPTGDPETLASAIARVLSERTLRQRLRANAITLASHFTWPAIVEKHLELYSRLR